MKHLLHTLEGRLATLPVPMAVELPTGQHLGAFVLTEPGAGTDVMAATTAAAKDGDAYVLNGTKTFISNGPVGDTFLVFCWTDKAAGRKGMSSFIIPKGTPGMKPGEAESGPMTTSWTLP